MERNASSLCACAHMCVRARTCARARTHTKTGMHILVCLKATDLTHALACRQALFSLACEAPGLSTINGVFTGGRGSCEDETLQSLPCRLSFDLNGQSDWTPLEAALFALSLDFDKGGDRHTTGEQTREWEGGVKAGTCAPVGADDARGSPVNYSFGDGLQKRGWSLNITACELGRLRGLGQGGVATGVLGCEVRVCTCVLVRGCLVWCECAV